uniref:Uncharacterized protein n=1 Tax=Setaria italica TaxID=4555 RepID=K3ZE22_SETIT
MKQKKDCNYEPHQAMKKILLSRTFSPGNEKDLFWIDPKSCMLRHCTTSLFISRTRLSRCLTKYFNTVEMIITLFSINFFCFITTFSYFNFYSFVPLQISHSMST